jgi:predicted Zn-ribbon and HTH transcriptional regulator
MADKENTITEKECKLCGHKWFPRTPARPLICPTCKSARWDIGRVRATGGGRKKQSDEKEHGQPE